MFTNAGKRIYLHICISFFGYSIATEFHSGKSINDVEPLSSSTEADGPENLSSISFKLIPIPIPSSSSENTEVGSKDSKFGIMAKATRDDSLFN